MVRSNSFGGSFGSGERTTGLLANQARRRRILCSEMEQSPIDAVAARFHAVNGRHAMTPEDDEYVSAWYVSVEELADRAATSADEIRRLMLVNRLPLPSYIRSDGAQMVARDLLDLLEEAGGAD